MTAVHVSTESKQVQVTPIEFVQVVAFRFSANFLLDAAATDENRRCEKWFTPEMDGLKQDWKAAVAGPEEFSDNARCVWLNPPFRGVAPWMQKCGEESAKGCKIISLTLASLGTGWYRDHVEGKALSLVLRDRITFDGEKDPFPKELMISLWGFGMTGLGFWSWKEDARKEYYASNRNAEDTGANNG
jgi:phage N-6-adenine-methyltransferase